ncbi:MAG: PEGA domain-containing protein [Candidatus Eisenbacteria sp.]|nr:PEGA domain-containing protein [Candidatus Eisenbacteria bacterium]
MARHCTVALILALSIVFIAGCGVILKGTKEGVHFTSDPDGALVLVNGVERGTTPLKLSMASKETYTITFRKEGHKDKTMVIENHVQAGWIVLDVLFGLVPVVVDAATGGWYTLDEHNVNAVMATP